jgi:hypothetical protein
MARAVHDFSFVSKHLKLFDYLWLRTRMGFSDGFGGPLLESWMGLRRRARGENLARQRASEEVWVAGKTKAIIRISIAFTSLTTQRGPGARGALAERDSERLVTQCPTLMGCWHMGHTDLLDVRNHFCRQGPWYLLRHVPQDTRGSWWFVLLMTAKQMGQGSQPSNSLSRFCFHRTRASNRQPSWGHAKEKNKAERPTA